MPKSRLFLLTKTQENESCIYLKFHPLNNLSMVFFQIKLHFVLNRGIIGKGSHSLVHLTEGSCHQVNPSFNALLPHVFDKVLCHTLRMTELEGTLTHLAISPFLILWRCLEELVAHNKTIDHLTSRKLYALKKSFIFYEKGFLLIKKKKLLQ